MDLPSEPATGLLVVVAHPDDETFGCGSLLAHATARGASSAVICATRGEAGTPTPGLGLEGQDIAVVREAELRSASALLGVSRVELLAYLDSDMEGDPAPGTLFAAPLDAVADEIVPFIDELRPEVIVTIDGSDGHRDHVHMRHATLLAAERAAWRTPRVYLHCLPQSLLRRWVEVLQAEQPESTYLHLGELGTPEDLITTVIDTSAYLDLREAAMALHASQTPPYNAMPPEVRRDFLTAERLRRVAPAWSGGPLETDIFTS